MKNLTLICLIQLFLTISHISYSQSCIIGNQTPCMYSLDYEKYNINMSPIFHCIPTGQNFNYNWRLISNKGKIKDPNSKEAEIIFNSSGPETLEVKVFNNGANFIFSFVIDIKLMQDPIISILPKHTCEGSGNYKFCKNETIYLSTQNVVGNTYSWEFNSIEIGNQASINSNISNLGIGEICLFVTSNTGCYSSNCQKIEIVDSPDADFTISQNPSEPIQICKNQPLYFMNMSQNTVDITYYWEILFNGQIIFNKQTLDHKDKVENDNFFTEPGNYIVRIRAINCVGCESVYEKTINVATEKIININCPSLVCQDPIKKIRYSADPGCTSYIWEVIGGTKVTSNGNILEVIWDQNPSEGYGLVKLSTTGCPNNICSGTTIIKVPIIPIIAPDIKGPRLVCNNPTSINYAILGYKGASYDWDIIPSNNPDLKIMGSKTSSSVNINAKNYQGQFQLKAKVMHPIGGCEFEKIIDVNVMDYEISGIHDFCYGESIVTSINPLLSIDYSINWIVNQNGILVYSESNNNINQFILNPQKIVQPGNYTLFANITKNGLMCSTPVYKFQILPIPNPPIIDGPQYICLGDLYSYTSSTTSNEWEIVGGIIVQNNDNNVDVIWSSTGTKLLRVRTMTNGCYSNFKSLEVINFVDSQIEIDGQEYLCGDSKSTYCVLSSPNANYTWSLSDPLLGSVQNQLNNKLDIYWLRVTSPKICTLSVSVTQCGITKTSFKIIHINPRQLADITITNACQGIDVNMSVNAPNGGTYFWDFGDGSTDETSLPNTTHRYNYFGNFEVFVYWETNENNCIELLYAKKLVNIRESESPILTAYRFINFQKVEIDCIPNEDLELCIEASMPRTQNITKFKWYIDGVLQPETGTELCRSVKKDKNHPFCGTIAAIPDDNSIECPIIKYLNILQCNQCTTSCTANILTIDNFCEYINFTGQFNTFSPGCIGPLNKFPFTKIPKGRWTIDGAIVKQIIFMPELSVTNQPVYNAGLHTLGLVPYMLGNSPSHNYCGIPFIGKINDVCEVPVFQDFMVEAVSRFDYRFECIDGVNYKLFLHSNVSFVPDLFEPTDYEWIIDNQVVGFGTDFNIDLAQGIYQIQLVVKDATRSKDCYSKVYSIEPPLPMEIPAIHTPTVVCQMSPYLFKFQDGYNFANIIDILWEFGDGTTSRNFQPRKTFPNAGFHTVKVTLTNKMGCTVTSFIIIMVSNNLTSVILNLQNDVCVNKKILSTLVLNGSGSYTYLWSNGSNLDNILINNSGTYTVTVTELNGCTNSASRNVKVSSDFTSDIEGNTHYCNNEFKKWIYKLNVDNIRFDYDVTITPPIPFIINISNNSLLSIEFNNMQPPDQIQPFTYRIRVTSHPKGSNTVICGENIFDFTVYDATNPILNNELISCEPSIFKITEVTNRIVDWYVNDVFQLTSSEISIPNGNIEARYTNMNGCIESAKLNLKNDLNIDFFLPGCYSICDIDLQNGDYFIPGSSNLFKSWKYILDGDLQHPIQSGNNSKVEKLILTEAMKGKIKLIVESEAGCTTSSAEFCLDVLNCGVKCEDLTITNLVKQVNVIDYDCNTGYRHFSLDIAFDINPETVLPCVPNPIEISNVSWEMDPIITKNGNHISITDAKFKVLFPACKNITSGKINLCLNNDICPFDFPIQLNCEDDCEDCDLVPNISCPHLSFTRLNLDCIDMTSTYSIYGDIAPPSGWEICDIDPIIVENGMWLIPPTITRDPIYPQIFHFSGGILKLPVSSCTTAVNVKIRICKGSSVCIKDYQWWFPCFNDPECPDPLVVINQSGEDKLNIRLIGRLFSILDCNTNFTKLRAVIYDADCQNILGTTIIPKPPINTGYDITIQINLSQLLPCYCVKFFYCNQNGSLCTEICQTSTCNGFNSNLTFNSSGLLNISSNCLGVNLPDQTKTFNVDFTYTGNDAGIRLDKFVMDSTHGYIDGNYPLGNTLNGLFTVPIDKTSVDLILEISNISFPNTIIQVSKNLILSNCNNEGGNQLRVYMPKLFELEIIPNPSSDYALFNYEIGINPIIPQIRIFSIASNREIDRLTCSAVGYLEYNVNKLDPGVYYVILEEDSNIRKIQKWVIIR